MSELRWTLLGLGLAFLVGLILWERRKRTRKLQASSEADTFLDQEQDQPRRTAGAEPALTLPSESLRGRMQDPQIIEIIDPAVYDQLESSAEGQPRISDLPPLRNETRAAVERAAAWVGVDIEGPVSESAPLRVEWPPDEQRRIVSLRIVPRSGERFMGAAVRQALVGEGLEFGEFDVFHKPLDDRRVVLSVASLTKPGTFDLLKMDPLGFAGLNAFTVLPGPLPAVESFDLLVATARSVADRLRGELTDTSGKAFDAARLAQRRAELAALPTAGDTFP